MIKYDSKRRHSLILTIGLSLITVGYVAADDELEKQLLGDLESELLKDDVNDASKDKDGAPKKVDPNAKQGGGTSDLLEPKDPLSKIARQMRLVEELISDANTSEKTQNTQREIVNDLTALIKQLQRQQQQQKSQGKGSGSAAKRPAPGSSAGAASRPSSESTDRVGKSKSSEVDQEAIKALIKEVWGHLPERIRDRIQTPSVDKFLPKYEKLIEDYFRRLAEQESQP